MRGARLPRLLRACGVLLLAAALPACAMHVSMAPESKLPADPAVRTAIAAIARAQKEVRDLPFVEERTSPKRLPAVARPVAKDAPDIGAIAARGELAVAMLGVDNPPFFWHTGKGELTGLDVLLARDLALALGVRLRINTAARTFDEVVDEVRTGRADMGISKLSRTSTRSKSVVFSSPYVELRRAFLGNRLAIARYAPDRLLVPAIQQFTGRLGVIAQSSYETFAHANFPRAQLVLFPTWSAEVDAVRTGAITAAFRDELEVNRILDGNPAESLNLRSIVFTDSSDTIAIALPWQDPDLRSFVDFFLESHGLERIPAEAILYVFPEKVAETPA